MKKRIKAIIFDIGGVLAINENATKEFHKSHINLGVHEQIAAKLKISLDQWLDSIDTAYAKSIEGKISKKKALNIISRNTKTPKRRLKKIIIEAYRNNFKQNKQLFKQAYRLKKAGYTIAVLSDQWYLSKEALVLPQLYHQFNEKIISCDVGLRKPNPKIYKLVLRRLNLHQHDALFIDNQKWNIVPAKKIGMKTILFKNNKQLFKTPLWKELFEK